MDETTESGTPERQPVAGCAPGAGVWPTLKPPDSGPMTSVSAPAQRTQHAQFSDGWST